MLRAYVIRTLADCAKAAVRLNHPVVIGVTGSVGKTSVKDAIAAVLSPDGGVRANQKSFNSEFGLPLTILDLPSGKRSPFRWLSILWKAKSRSARPDPSFPKTLVLEMGVQKPGDMDELLAIVPPTVGVITAIGESHAEFLGGPEGIAKEKGKLIEALPAHGLAVLNADDAMVAAMAGRTKAKVLTYGFGPGADLRADAKSVRYHDQMNDGLANDTPGDAVGTTVGLSYKGQTAEAFLSGVLGLHSAYAPLAAAAVAVGRGMPLSEAASRLSAYVPPAGRMRAIAGIKHTLLIDDTYNASPRSTLAALQVLAAIPVDKPGDDKKIAVLGDMLELGSLSDSGHRQVGLAAAGCADMLVLVGERMGLAEAAAKEAGMMEDRIFHFSTSSEAGRFVQERMKRGDIVLIKGSQGMRMERVSKELMADPLHAPALLVRQDWADA